METIERINTICIRLSLFLAGLGLVSLVLLTTANVGMRLFSQSMYGVVEIVTWFAVCINALGLAFAQESRENVAITLFTDGRSTRTRILLDIAGLLVGVFFAIVAIWGLYRYIGIQIRTNQVSTSLHLPYWPVIAVIPAGLALFLVTLITDLLRNINKLTETARSS